MEIYKDIRRMRLGGMSQRQIAGALHISRNTVKKSIGMATASPESARTTAERLPSI